MLLLLREQQFCKETIFIRTVLKEIGHQKTQLVNFEETKYKKEKLEKRESQISNYQCKEDCQSTTAVIKVANLLSFTNFVQNSKETYL